MANPVLGPIGLQGRTETHRKELMTLYVTRQEERFITSRYMQLCDIELINAEVQLVGEPGLSGSGFPVGAAYTSTATPTTLTKGEFMFHNSTINVVEAINGQGIESTVMGQMLPNRIVERPHLNHRNVNVRIEGMRANHQFRQDELNASNQLDLCIPTDLGLAEHRALLASWPPTPIVMEAVRLEQQMVVSTDFSGNGPVVQRRARFVQDWADSDASRRNADGTVKYFTNNNEKIDEQDPNICLVPSNMIVAMKLIFQITPRTTL